MQTRTELNMRRPGSRWLLYLLLAIPTACGTALAADTTVRHAQTTYRVIQLSAGQSAFSADINARGQVAFTETVDGVARAKFYDGNAVRDLGTLGGPSATAAAVNDLGQVAGGASINADGSMSHAYRWSQQTGMVDLGPGLGESSGSDINNKGEVTGAVVFRPDQDLNRRAFFWSPRTGMLNIGTLDLASSGVAINDAGAITGDSGGNSLQTFRWTRREGIRPIVTMYNEFNLASDINAAGHAIGAGPFVEGGQAHAYLWTRREGLIDLGTGTGNRSSAKKINDKDMVVGQVIDFTNIFHGFIWTRKHGLTELGAGSPALGTSAEDVNNRGQVVGGFGEYAYVWTRAQGVIDLNSRVVGAPAGLLLSAGTAISDNGSIVARANTGLVLLVPIARAAHEEPVEEDSKADVDD